MYFLLTEDSGLKGPYETEADALDASVGNEIKAWHEGKITPELLTAQRFTDGYEVPFSMEPDVVFQIEDLKAEVDVPVEKIAQDAVETERELKERDTYPADASPLESDRHVVDVKSYIQKRADMQTFERVGCGDAYCQFINEMIEETEERIRELWGDNDE